MDRDLGDGWPSDTQVARTGRERARRGGRGREKKKKGRKEGGKKGKKGKSKSKSKRKQRKERKTKRTVDGEGRIIIYYLLRMIWRMAGPKIIRTQESIITGTVNINRRIIPAEYVSVLRSLLDH